MRDSDGLAAVLGHIARNAIAKWVNMHIRVSQRLPAAAAAHATDASPPAALITESIAWAIPTSSYTLCDAAAAAATRHLHIVSFFIDDGHESRLVGKKEVLLVCNVLRGKLFGVNDCFILLLSMRLVI